MRVYKPEKAGDIIQGMRESSNLLRLLEVHRRLKVVWQKVPDPTLRQLDLMVRVDAEGRVQIECTSSVALAYVRSRRQMIENFLRQNLQNYNIQNVTITLQKR